MECRILPDWEGVELDAVGGARLGACMTVSIFSLEWVMLELSLSTLLINCFLTWSCHPQRYPPTTLTITSSGLGRARRELLMLSVFFLELELFFLVAGWPW